MRARRRRSWPVPVVGAALTGVLSSGVTALYLRATMPDVLAVDGDLHLTPEQRHLAALLVAPAAPFVPAGEGKPVDTATGLTALGFERGWNRTWQASGDQKVDAFVLEFRDAAGARTYARGVGGATRLLTEPRAFTVAGVPGSGGLVDTVSDKDGNYTGVLVMHEGRRAVLLVFTTASASPDTVVAELAQRQWAALAT